MAYIEEIREMSDGSVRDGVLAGTDRGYFRREIQEASYEYQQRVDAGEEVVVGVNQYQIDDDPDLDILRVDESTRDRQPERLERVKDSHSGSDSIQATTSWSAHETGNEPKRRLLSTLTNFVTLGNQ